MSDHFADVGKMVNLGSVSSREVSGIKPETLSAYNVFYSLKISLFINS